MGSGSFNAASYRSFTHTTAGKTVDQVFTSRTLDKDLNPKGVRIRESRDSADNPKSTPVIVGIDVTGSMGIIADTLAKKGLGTLFENLLDPSSPLTNPHLMFMAIGDANFDRAPLQVSQFEADNRIVDQLTKIWVEHGGGGNGYESYNLPWYFAAHHTEHDSLIKRGKRGYLFTVGDEEAPQMLTRAQIEQFIGDTPEGDLSSAEMLAEARRKYEVYHVIIEEGNYASQSPDRVLASWTPLLGERVIRLKDHTKLAETIVSAIEIAEGRDAQVVTQKFGKVVLDAVQHLPASRKPRLALT